MVVMETRIGGDRAKEVTDRLPFDGAIHTEMIGMAGGIWLLWNSDRVEVVHLANTEQEIHVEVKLLPSNLSWIFTAVYASSRCVERQILWGNLSKVAEFHNLPWVTAGDFNEPLVDGDKFGGRLRQPKKLMEKIDIFAKQATLWSKDHFGNIFHTKKRIIAHLDGVQRAMASDPSSSLVNLENHLIKELDIVLEQEKELWALKSRINWMVLGDRNTSFYHVLAITRRKRNLITAIKNGVGEWLTDEREVALWSLKAFKALGPDGLHAGFFQRFWHIVGGSVREEVNWQNKTISRSADFSLSSGVCARKKGVDNAIIVQEIIHTMGKAKGKTGYMALKIDLEKAYDKLE
ncbi:uncharacterized protein LOC142634916 [Castanea sativa]|uniref:uncharacterized protein LOC142634916 n=1 Tax=Castanea sativa TaxID=21020 RepID=UPI003F6492E8